MATDQKVIGDVGSDLLQVVIEQLNRLTIFVEAIQAAALTDGNTFQAAVEALTNQDTDINIVVEKALPTPPRFPQV
jgi:hypothetical protein